MKMLEGWKRVKIACAVFSAFFAISTGIQAEAQEYSGAQLSCDNGRTYPIRYGAISSLGDVVTGVVVTGRSRGIPFRLVPMGDGYRYAGRNIWFDGEYRSAVLYWGTPQAVACAVIQD